MVGDAEVAERAGGLELRVRQARRNGAHLAIVGPGGAKLERDAGTFVATQPGSDGRLARRAAREGGDLAALGEALAAARAPDRCS